VGVSSTEDALAQCERVLSSQGRLATAIPGFTGRTAQITLATHIARAINEQSTLVAEAGTGTGKTFAYLIPCLLSARKALISTATKTLQDQLFLKDLPVLIRALGLSTRVENLKGRANYLCRYRIALHIEEGRILNQQAMHDLLLVQGKLPQISRGERSELPEISEHSAVWPYATSTAENCLGSECEYYTACFLIKARKRALDADIVVTNHHLFFADSRLKDEGFGELLPDIEVVIFDEAHQLAETAAHFQGERVGTRQIRDLIDDLLREWPILDLPNQPFKELSLTADRIFDALLLALPKEERIAWDKLKRNSAFMSAWQALMQLINSFLECLRKSDFEGKAGIIRCHQRFEELQHRLSSFNEVNKIQIRWLERFKHSLLFLATPFDIADYFGSLVTKRRCAYIFTSATLTMASSFDCFMKPLGLANVRTLALASPFDYGQQALLYLPRGLPDPKDATYYEILLEKALPVINALGGRSFFLFTSHRALKLVAQRLSNTLNYPLLVQGEEAKSILLARFRQLGNAVLLGTATFWEGVDVKGEALSCVIIDKLPFASLTDPVIQGKMAYFKSQGLSGFDELSLPNAILALKQGVGRLIRDVSDRGVLMIADPRLTSREYGRHIFASLPSLRKTRDEQTVLAFIHQLTL
jgi:ATP-dependent DNA helicase DinG